MSGSASIDLERQMLQHTLAIAPMPTLSRVYVALCLTAPTEAAGGTEASGGGYARAAATFALMASPSNAASNATSVEFLAATSAWGTIGYFEIWTQPTGGTRLYWGPLTDPADGVPIEMDVTAGDVVRFSPGTLMVQASDVVPTHAAPAAGMENVLDYGADPTGATDSSAAINAAAAVVGPNGRHRTVYLPTGTYRVNHQITLTQSQGLIGDTRGSSVLYVDDQFDPAVTSVIMCRAAFQDAGPVLRDFGITFAQPQDQGSRANFKTLAAGGTSSPGGTGVKYPWAIASGDDSFRIQIKGVRIVGAWDGITTNGHNTVYWIDDLEIGALSCGLSLGEGVGVQDFSHITGYHFWSFGIGSALLDGVFYDGQVVSLRVGRVDGLEIRGFSSFVGRLVVTADAAGFTGIMITNCMMDTHQATIEVNGNMALFHISNLSGSAGTDRLRPLVQVNASCPLDITNFYSHSSSNYPDFLLTHDSALVTLTNFRSLFYTNNIPWVEVQRGQIRLLHGHLFTPGPRTVAVIAETVNGVIVVDDLTVNATVASGPLISAVTNSSFSSIGQLSLQPSHAWTFPLPSGLTQKSYSPIANFQLPTSTSYANDAAAAAGGVLVGELYRNGSAVMVRVA